MGSYCPDATPGGEPVTLGFGIADGSATKTSINDDGKSVSWSGGDKVRLWAVNSSGATVIDGHPFTMLGSFGNEAIFTAQFANPMPEDTYTYYACYPNPSSSNGDVLRFTLPANQDGRASGGADIMISGPVTHGALKPLGKDSSSDFRMVLKHMVHILKFYLPEGSNGLEGESVRKIRVEFPGNVVGTMSVNRADPSETAVLTDGGSTVTLDLVEPLTVSSSTLRNYASASICPSTFVSNAKMKVTLFSDNFIGMTSPISIGGRDFKAGHTTAAKLNVTGVAPYYTFKLKLVNNYLGEDIRKVTVTLDDNTLHLGDEGASSYTFDPGRNIPVGEIITFSYEDRNSYLALDGHTVTLTYESEHVRSVETFKIHDLQAHNSYTFGMTVPYLLFEDFSTVNSFSSHDEYKTSETGDRDPVSFLNGWTGARIGGRAGTSIRIAARRETGAYLEARYPARVDSCPLPEIIKTVDISVTFSYSTDNKYLNSGSNLGQVMYVGYVTSTKGYSSSSTDGTYECNEVLPGSTGGSYSVVDQIAQYTLHDIPIGKTVRISWRNNSESNNQFAGNSTNWLYIDNVKVVVAPK